MGDETARKGKCKLPSGTPPGDSLVPIDQGLASGTIPHGLELKLERLQASESPQFQHRQR